MLLIAFCQKKPPDWRAMQEGPLCSLRSKCKLLSASEHISRNATTTTLLSSPPLRSQLETISRSSHRIISAGLAFSKVFALHLHLCPPSKPFKELLPAEQERQPAHALGAPLLPYPRHHDVSEVISPLALMLWICAMIFSQALALERRWHASKRPHFFCCNLTLARLEKSWPCRPAKAHNPSQLCFLEMPIRNLGSSTLMIAQCSRLISAASLLQFLMLQDGWGAESQRAKPRQGDKRRSARSLAPAEPSRPLKDPWRLPPCESGRWASARRAPHWGARRCRAPRKLPRSARKRRARAWR